MGDGGKGAGGGEVVARTERRREDLQELVEEGEDDGEDDSHDPETEGHDGDSGVILVRDNGGNLRDGRVLLLLEDDGRALDIELLVDELFFSSEFLLLVGHDVKVCGE